MDLGNILHNLDVNAFIEEVRKQPFIWNADSLELVNKKFGRQAAWDIVCEKFYPNFQDLSVQQKESVSIGFQKKWKNLKDSFNREQRIMNEAKRGVRRGKVKYQYYDQLSFLLSKSKGPASIQSYSDSDECVSAYEDDISNQEVAEASKGVNQNHFSVEERESSSYNAKVANSYEDARPDRTTNEGKYSMSEATGNTTSQLMRPSRRASSKRMYPSDTLDDENTTQPSKNMRVVNLTQIYRSDIAKEPSKRIDIMSLDEDTLFCLSLVSDFKRISDNLKCDAKCEILHVLKNYKTYSSPSYGNLHQSRNFSNHNQPHPSYTNAGRMGK